jgi:hypothetical protein
VAGITFADFIIEFILSNRLSGTPTVPILDLVALKAKFDDSALVFDMQLKIVVLPMLVNPIMPQFKAICGMFKFALKGKYFVDSMFGK